MRFDEMPGTCGAPSAAKGPDDGAWPSDVRPLRCTIAFDAFVIAPAGIVDLEPVAGVR
jgi:hypothetical protein